MIGAAGSLFAPVREDFDFSQSRVRFRVDPFSTGVDLGVLHTGDTLAYVYTLTAEGTTHGFERAYDAFIGDPFGADVVTGNLILSATPASDTTVPEPASWILLIVGFGGVVALAHRRATRQPLSAMVQL